MYCVASNKIFCPACGSQSTVLGSVEGNQNRVQHHCQCSACLLTFDRILAPNGKGVTTLYAVPASDRARRFARVVSPAREDAHAS